MVFRINSLYMYLFYNPIPFVCLFVCFLVLSCKHSHDSSCRQTVCWCLPSLTEELAFHWMPSCLLKTTIWSFVVYSKQVLHCSPMLGGKYVIVFDDNGCSQASYARQAPAVQLTCLHRTCVLQISAWECLCFKLVSFVRFNLAASLSPHETYMYGTLF